MLHEPFCLGYRSKGFWGFGYGVLGLGVEPIGRVKLRVPGLRAYGFRGSGCCACKAFSEQVLSFQYIFGAAVELIGLGFRVEGLGFRV